MGEVRRRLASNPHQSKLITHSSPLRSAPLIGSDISDGDEELEKEGEVLNRAVSERGAGGHFSNWERGLICATIQGRSKMRG